MKKPSSVFNALALALVLGAGTALAAPQHGQHEPEQGQRGNTDARQSASGKSQQASPSKQTSASKPVSPSKLASLPKDFAKARQAFQQNRQQIGRGGSVPANVSIAKGKPLPSGYGKRLDARQLNGVPQYDGYEWRRVGSDMVLVALTTGIVHTILQGVLN